MPLALLQAGADAQVSTLAKTWSEQGPSAAVFGALCVAVGVLFTGLVAALIRMVSMQARHAKELAAADKEHRTELAVLQEKLLSFATESLPTMKALVELGADIKLLVTDSRKRTEAAARGRARPTGTHATIDPDPKKAEGG